MKEWFGILVTEQDFLLLSDDYCIFGRAFVEKTDEKYGRRIDPKDIYIHEELEA